MLKREWWKLGIIVLLSVAAIVPSGCAARRRVREAQNDVVNPPEPPPSWSKAEPPASGTPAQKPLIQQVTAQESLDDQRGRVEPIATTNVAQAPLSATQPPPNDTLNAPQGSYSIDLPTALRLAQGDNLQVAFAREQVTQAWTKYDAARVMWLPSIRTGLNYNKHDAQIQDITGNVFPASRSNSWAGLGAATPGAGSPAYPGLYMNFHLADALFEPLAAQQAAFARRHAADAVANDVLWRVSLGYIELVRAAQELAIARDVERTAAELVKLTADHAAAGQGSPADADRAAAEWSIRRNDVLRAQESTRVASARLAQLLRLDPCLQLEPLDPLAVPVDLVPLELSRCDLVTWGLSNRPELAQHRHLVSEAVERMRRSQYSVLMPSVVLGASYGVFGGGQAQAQSNFGNRFDGDAIAYWQMRQLGFGDVAARNDARSQVRQANVAQMAIMDQVCREVIEAHAQVDARRGQIEIAREGIVSAERSQLRNLERIRNLQGLPLEMLQSNQALAQARREYLRTVADYNTAQVTLYHAVGSPGDIPSALESSATNATSASPGDEPKARRLRP